MDYIDFEKVFAEIKKAEVLTHYLHLSAESYATHEALGSFYEELNNCGDRFAEVVLSDVPYRMGIPDKLCFEFDTKDPELYIYKFRDFIKNYEMMGGLCVDIKNIFADIVELCSKTIYLLKLK